MKDMRPKATMIAALAAGCAMAAVPLRWTVETSRAAPAAFEQFKGTELALEAALTTYGKPLEIEGEPRLYWQTNGMATAWWSAPATVSGNVMRATFAPRCDVGASLYTCFIGIPGSVYSAAFRLRLLPSPGATPNALAMPAQSIDFATVEVMNAPWATTDTVAGLASTVSALWSYAYGETVWIAVTNYMRTVEGVVPSLQLWEVRDNVTNLVYSTAEEVSNAVAKAESRISADIQGGLAAVRADIPSTAWSRYQSMTGAENPDPENVTVVSTPSVMLTGGAEWTQYLDASSNCLWVLSSRGLVVPSVDTNGYFRIIDAEGNAAFEVVKRGAQTVDALPQSSPSVSNGVMSVTFYAVSKPTLYTAETLTGGAFSVEGEDPNASVEWTDGGDGTWTAAISFVDVKPSYFCYATFTRQGGTAIKATAPMSLDGGISVGGKVIRPVINGTTVTWEVAQ